MKTLFAFSGYPNITAVAYNATAFQIPGSASLELPAVVAADPASPCACHPASTPVLGNLTTTPIQLCSCCLASAPELREGVVAIGCCANGAMLLRCPDSVSDKCLLYRAAPGGLNVTFSNVTAFCLERPTPSSSAFSAACALSRHAATRWSSDKVAFVCARLRSEARVQRYLVGSQVATSVSALALVSESGSRCCSPSLRWSAGCFSDAEGSASLMLSLSSLRWVSLLTDPASDLDAAPDSSILPHYHLMLLTLSSASVSMASFKKCLTDLASDRPRVAG